MSRVLVALALAFCSLTSTLAQAPTGAIAQVDARAEVAAALFSASATLAAAERVADAKLRAQRTEIESLRSQVRGGAAQLRAALTAAEEKYVAALAARDRTYAQEIAVFRAAVEDIAKTPEGVAALARFNTGDQVGALAVLDDLRAARDAARRKRADIESASEARRIATLARDARAKGNLTTVQVISRYEEVTRLDPGEFWDWVHLGRLYRDAGRLPDALRAANAAAAIATSDRDRAVVLSALGDVQEAQGDLVAALANYRAMHAIAERLAQANSDDVLAQQDLFVSYHKLGNAQRTQGELSAALASYQASAAIAQGLVRQAPLNPYYRLDLLASHNSVGDVLMMKGDVSAALVSYRKALAISELLADAQRHNADWQNDLLARYVRMAEITGDKAYAERARRQELRMLRAGIVTPGNAWMIEDLKRREGR